MPQTSCCRQYVTVPPSAKHTGGTFLTFVYGLKRLPGQAASLSAPVRPKTALWLVCITLTNVPSLHWSIPGAGVTYCKGGFPPRPRSAAAAAALQIMPCTSEILGVSPVPHVASNVRTSAAAVFILCRSLTGRRLAPPRCSPPLIAAHTRCAVTSARAWRQQARQGSRARHPHAWSRAMRCGKHVDCQCGAFRFSVHWLAPVPAALVQSIALHIAHIVDSGMQG